MENWRQAPYRWTFHAVIWAVVAGCAESQQDDSEVESEFVSESEIAKAMERSRPPRTPEYDPIPDQSLLQVNRIAKGKRVSPEVRVRLREGGRLTIHTGAGWIATTLSQLAERLQREKERHHRIRQADGKSGFDVDDWGSQRVSRIFVEIDVRPDTRWEHVLWLFAICEERTVDKVQLRVGDRTLHIFLLWDAAIEWTIEPPLTYYAIVVLAREGRASYMAGNQELKGLPGVQRHLLAARAASKRANPEYTFVPVLIAERTVAAKQLLDALEMLIDGGMPRVLFYEVKEEDEEDANAFKFDWCRIIPRAKDRDETTLPVRK